MNDTPAIIVNVQKQPGANVIQVVDRVKQLLPTLTAALPASMEVQLLTDRTVTIRASVHDTQFELLLAIALGGDGDLRVPADRAGTLIPEHRGAACRSSAPSASCTSPASASTTSPSWRSPSPPASWSTTPSW
jgi:hypothetical protein